MSDLDGLWERTHQQTWYDGQSDDVKEFLCQVADLSIEKGELPGSGKLRDKLRELWPDVEVHKDTVRTTLKRLVEERK